MSIFRKLSKRLPFVIVGILVAAIAFSSANEALTHHNQPPILPGVPNTPAIQKSLKRGYIKYKIDPRLASYPGFIQGVNDVVAQGDFLLGIPAIYDDNTPDVVLTAPTDADFVRICGSGAAACIVYWSDPAIIYYRIALQYYDWKTTISHEGINFGHLMGEHEQYDDINFRCIEPAQPTVMSCGTGVWIPTLFDRLTVWGVVTPDLPSAAGVVRHKPCSTCDEYAFVWYNGERRDGGYGHWGNTKLDNVSRVEIYYMDWWEPGIWRYPGFDGPPPVNGYGDRGFEVTYWCVPYRVWGVRPVNEFRSPPYVSEWRDGISILPVGSC